MKDVRFALIGGGFMGKAHSIALASYPMYVWPTDSYPVREVMVEATDDLADEAQKRFGFNRKSTDWQGVVNDPSIDVIDIVLPNAMHYEVVMAALAAGKHVICEKPLAMTLQQGAAMAELANKKGLINQTGFNWRLTPAIQQARKLVDEGVLGEIRSIRSHWIGEFFADPTIPLVWRFEKALAGSGALGDLGSHAIDFARFMCGDFDQVSGMQSTYVTERDKLDGSGKGVVDVDDMTSFIAKFKSGATGYVECSWASPGRKTFAGFELYGSQGSIIFDWERMTEFQLYEADAAGDRQGYKTVHVGPPHPGGQHFWPIAGYQIGYADTKVLQFADFFATLEGRQEKAQTDFADGLYCMKVEHAVANSIASRSWQSIH